MAENYKLYEKLALNINQQLELLIKQGLVVKNPNRVLHYLCFIGYHHLSGYFYFFQIPGNPDHIFEKDTTFDGFVKSQKYALLSFPRRRESSNYA